MTHDANADPNLIAVTAGGRQLAWILRADRLPASTEFVTPPTSAFQAGFIVYPAGGQVRPHLHRPVERVLTDTSEALLVRKGRMHADFYDIDGEQVATHEMSEGDVLVLLAGGHGFRMEEDTVLIEIKQGPYHGIDEKEFL